MNLAPIVLFVYNRSWHTKQTVEALQKNELAKESELFIFSDAAKNEDMTGKVNEVRKYIQTIDGFKKVTIIERNRNWGLADSIIDGVTKIINKYEKVIVLEDDMVTSPYFLRFMNEALEYYKDEKRVWHISGWNYPIETKGLADVFLYRLMNCWGWATWKDRWSFFEKDTNKLISKYSHQEIKHFNLDGYIPYWDQVMANKEGRIDTWAVYWYATIHQREGLCLNPSKPYLTNIGLDGTGVHCNKGSKEKNSLLSDKKSVLFESNIVENKLAVKSIKKYFSLNKIKLFYKVIMKGFKWIK